MPEVILLDFDFDYYLFERGDTIVSLYYGLDWRNDGFFKIDFNLLL
jgi:hypothetical protein